MNAWLKAGVQGVTGGLTLGVVLLAGGRAMRPLAESPGNSVADVVKAQSVEVVDKVGRIRARLDGSGLWVMGEDFLPGAHLGDASLIVFGEDRDRVTARLAASRTASLDLSAGDRNVSLDLNPRSGPHFEFNVEGKTRVSLNVWPDGRAGLSLHDTAGVPLPGLRHGGGGQERVYLGVSESGNPSLELMAECLPRLPPALRHA